jgi:hypothetical protein
MALAKSTKTTKKPPAEPVPQDAEVTAWKKATRKLKWRIEILTTAGIQTIAGNRSVDRGKWIAVVPTAPTPRRYTYVIQWQRETKDFILCHLVDGAGATRLPGSGWLRALDTGRLHVLASDIYLTRAQVAIVIGGHEPNMGVAKPPNT